MVSPAVHAQIDKYLPQIASVLARTPRAHLPTLIQGNAGIALFHAYWHAYQPTETAHNQLIEQLEAALERASTMDQTPFLGTGFTGLSWVIAHLINEGLLEADANELIEDVRHLIEKSVDGARLRRDYDLLYGFIGTGLFFMEDQAADYASVQRRLLERLEIQASRFPTGVAWHSALGKEAADINLGLAHGSPGIVLYLLGLHEQGIEPARCRALLYQAVDYVLAQQQPGHLSLFPAVASASQAAFPSRLAWCHGDLGIAYTVLRVGLYFEDAALITKGQGIALEAAARDIFTGQVAESADQLPSSLGFCHGTAGIAFLFLKIAGLTHNAALAQRAAYWLDLTLAHLGVQLQALTEPFFIKPFHPEDPDTESRYGLLDGIAGVGLVLLAFVNPHRTGWARIFLLNK